MRLILRQDIRELGHKGDIVDVADGYARNYLLPRGLALVASEGAIAQAGAMRRSRDLADAKAKAGAQEIAVRISGRSVTIKARVGAEGRLFGSVTAADIADAVHNQLGVELDRRKLHLDGPIKTAGTHDIAAKLHADVEARVIVEVVG
jgi:large subunit ribosomal protein L9